ncbi:ATPase, AAA family [Nocardioides sp. PD653]|nr:ATPase, AAA family [Nocardioides sp. PD653]
MTMPGPIARAQRMGELMVAGYVAQEAMTPITSIENDARRLNLHQRDAEAAGFTPADIEQAVMRGAERAAQEQSPRERLLAAEEGSPEHLQALRYGVIASTE